MIKEMPHRFISFTFLDFIIGFLPAPLLGVLLNIDTVLVAHMLAVWAGAYIKFLYDVKKKKENKGDAIMYALAGVGGGYIIGNGFNFYYQINDLQIQLVSLFFSGILSVLIAMTVIKIAINLEKESWGLTKESIRNWLNNFLKSK